MICSRLNPICGWAPLEARLARASAGWIPRGTWGFEYVTEQLGAKVVAPSKKECRRGRRATCRAALGENVVDSYGEMEWVPLPPCYENFCAGRRRRHW